MACSLWNLTTLLSAGLFVFFLICSLRQSATKEAHKHTGTERHSSNMTSEVFTYCDGNHDTIQFLYHCTFCQLLLQCVSRGCGEYWFKIKRQRQTLVYDMRHDFPWGHCFSAPHPPHHCLNLTTCSSELPGLWGILSYMFSGSTEPLPSRNTTLGNGRDVVCSVWYTVKTNLMRDIKS